MKLEGKQIEKLQKALLRAYPNHPSLKQMVRAQLDEQLAHIAGGENLNDVVFNLITWAESQGRLEELVEKAHQHNPRAEELRAFISQFTALPLLPLDKLPAIKSPSRLGWYFISSIALLFTLTLLLNSFYWFWLRSPTTDEDDVNTPEATSGVIDQPEQPIKNEEIADPSPTMPEDYLNIVVAKFEVIDQTDQKIENDKITEQYNSIIDLLNKLSKDNFFNPLKREQQQQVKILTPNIILEVKEEEEEQQQQVQELAEELDASVLIYGKFEQNDDTNWEFSPKFYLNRNEFSQIAQAEDLFGNFKLGRAINYIPNNSVTVQKFNGTIEGRLEALVKLIEGLGHYEYGKRKAYEDATAIFLDLTENSEWVKEEEKTGQEILYLFLGNSYLKLSPYAKDVPEERLKLLEESEKAYQRGIELNQEYARLYNGLGFVRFQKARPPSLEGENRCEWQWNILSDAREGFEEALEAEIQPPSGDIKFRAYLGLGRIYFAIGLCPENEERSENWNGAQDYYTEAINIYKANPKPHLRILTTVAYSDLGYISLVQANSSSPDESQQRLTYAINNYKLAIDLAEEVKTEEGEELAEDAILYLLTAYCVDKQWELYDTTLDKFVSKKQNPLAVRTAILENLAEECKR